MRKPIKHLYKFGSFHLDSGERVLTCEGKTIPLAPKVFDTLLVLLENNGSVLEKDELLKTLWPDTIVEESNLTTYISQLRKALGENGSEQNYIETIPRRGYRFVANVQEVQPEFADILTHERTSTRIIVEEEIEPDFVPPSAPIVVAQKPAQRQLNFSSSQRILWFALPLTFCVFALIWGITQWRSKAALPFENVAISRVTTSGKNLLAAISPDGKYIAYVVRDTPQQSLWLRQTATTSNVQIVPPAEAQFMPFTFSPDGTQIFYPVYEKLAPANALQIGVLYQIPILGGTPRKILEDIDSQIALSPDGKQLAFIRNIPAKNEQQLILANIDGSAQRVLLTLTTAAGFPIPNGLAWSPDGKTLAFPNLVNAPGNKQMCIRAVDISSGKETIIGTNKWHWVGQVAWLPDGKGLLANAWDFGSNAISDQLWFIAYPDGAAKQVTKDVNNYQGLSYSSHTNALVTVQTTRLSRIWVLTELNEAQAVPITAGLGDSYGEFLGLAWTPDEKILYGSQASGNSDIWSMDSDGKNQKQISTDPLSDIMPTITPDKQTILYQSFRDGISHLWKMRVDGTDPQQLTNGKGEASVSVTPDSQWAVYLEEGKELRSIWKIPLAGGQPQLISDLPFTHAVIAPDGQTIAGLSFDTQAKVYQIILLSFADGKIIKTIPLKSAPRFGLLRWRPDGKAITYIVNENAVANLWQQPIDGTAPQPITHFTNDLIFRFAWSPDGKKLAIERGINVSDIILVKGQQ